MSSTRLVVDLPRLYQTTIAISGGFQFNYEILSCLFCAVIKNHETVTQCEMRFS